MIDGIFATLFAVVVAVGCVVLGGKLSDQITMDNCERYGKTHIQSVAITCSKVAK